MKRYFKKNVVKRMTALMLSAVMVLSVATLTAKAEMKDSISYTAKTVTGTVRNIGQLDKKENVAVKMSVTTEETEATSELLFGFLKGVTNLINGNKVGFNVIVKNTRHSGRTITIQMLEDSEWTTAFTATYKDAQDGGYRQTYTLEIGIVNESMPNSKTPTVYVKMNDTIRAIASVGANYTDDTIGTYLNVCNNVQAAVTIDNIKTINKIDYTALSDVDVKDFADVSEKSLIAYETADSANKVKNLGVLEDTAGNVAVKMNVSQEGTDSQLRFGFFKPDGSTIETSGYGFHVDVTNSETNGRTFTIWMFDGQSTQKVTTQTYYSSLGGIYGKGDGGFSEDYTLEIGIVNSSESGEASRTVYVKMNGALRAYAEENYESRKFGTYLNVSNLKQANVTIGSTTFNSENYHEATQEYDFSEICDKSQVTLDTSDVISLGTMPTNKNTSVKMQFTGKDGTALSVGFSKIVENKVDGVYGFQVKFLNNDGSGRRIAIYAYDANGTQTEYKSAQLYSGSGLVFSDSYTLEIGVVNGSANGAARTIYVKVNDVVYWTAEDYNTRERGYYLNVKNEHTTDPSGYPITIESAVLDSKKVGLTLTDSFALQYDLSWKESLKDAARNAMFEMNDMNVNGTVTGDYNNSLAVFAGIRAQNIADTVKATFSAGDESVVYRYSVMDYFKTMLDSTDTTITKLSEMKHLIVDLIQYGAEVQKYRGETDTLSAYVTEAYAANDTDKATEATFDSLDGVVASTEKLTGTATDADPKWKSVALVLKDKINMRCKFNASDVTNLTVKVYLEGTSDPIKTLDQSNFVAIDQNGNYYLDFDNIQVNEYNKKFSFKFYKGEDIVGQTLNYSVNTYLNAKQGEDDMSDLLKAINACGIAAQAYVSEQ